MVNVDGNVRLNMPRSGRTPHRLIACDCCYTGTWVEGSKYVCSIRGELDMRHVINTGLNWERVCLNYKAKDDTAGSA